MSRGGPAAWCAAVAGWTWAACFEAPPRPEPSEVASESDANSDSTDATSDDAAACDGCATAPCFVARGDGCAPVGALALGAGFGCAALADGAVWCWGARDRGQVGDLVVASAPSPPVRVALPRARAVAAGDAHACALTITGEVWCWGRNAEGQVSADGVATAWSARPGPIALPAAAHAIEAGARTSCALLVDGRVVCWGALLDGQSMAESVPGGRIGALAEVATLPGAPGVSAIRVGTWSACAWSSALEPPLGATSAEANDVVRCWGDNAQGQLGLGDRLDRAIAERLAPLAGLDALALGDRHACALGPARALRCWGDNGEGQLAQPLGSAADLPSATTSLAHDALALALGDANGCVIDAERRVSCWGRAQEGVLGVGATGSRVRPEPVLGVPPARALALGRRHACAVTRDDGVVCWGHGREGQLDGTPRVEPSPTPIVVVAPPEPAGARCVVPDGVAAGTEVLPGAPHPTERCRVCARDLGFVACSLGCAEDGGCHAIEALALGPDETCAARSDGALVCWDEHGATASATDVMHVDEVALGAAWGCARVGDAVRCWPRGGDSEPVLAGASALDVHGARACAVVAGEVRCWSRGEAPSAVFGVASFGTARDVAIADESACAILEGGLDLVCWGSDAHGERAGAPELDGAPGLVPRSETLAFDGVAAGDHHFVGLRDLGRVLVAWGDNRAAQVDALGDVPTLGLAAPLALRTRPARPLVDVAAGAEHSCAMSLSGRVECWGDQGLADAGGVRTVVEGATRLAAHGHSTCAVVSDHVVLCWRGSDAPTRVVVEGAP